MIKDITVASLGMTQCCLGRGVRSKQCPKANGYGSTNRLHNLSVFESRGDRRHSKTHARSSAQLQ